MSMSMNNAEKPGAFDSEPVATTADGRQVGTPLHDLVQHPRSSYSERPKGPIDYVLVHKHPSWLLPVLRDKKNRTGSDYQAEFAAFTADIREHGMLQPIIAVKEGDAARVVDGETRRQAALLAGLDSIPILVYECELTENQLVIAQLQSNAQRRGFTEIELAAIYVELMQLNGWNQQELARNIHVTASKVSKILAISLRLCPEVQALVTAGKLAPRAAYAISRLADPAKQIEVAEKVVQGLLCVEGVEWQVSKGKRAPKEKTWSIKLANVTASIKGDLLAGVESLVGHCQEIIKRLKRGDGTNPLGGLVN